MAQRGFPGENIPISVKRGASSSPAEHLKQLRLPFALLPSVTCALRARTSARRQIIAFILICQNNWRKPVSSESYGDHAREIVSPLFKPALLLLSLCTNLCQSRITLAVTGTRIWHRLQSQERVVGAAAGALWGPAAPQARGVWVVFGGRQPCFHVAARNVALTWILHATNPAADGLCARLTSLCPTDSRRRL